MCSCLMSETHWLRSEVDYLMGMSRKLWSTTERISWQDGQSTKSRWFSMAMMRKLLQYQVDSQLSKSASFSSSFSHTTNQHSLLTIYAKTPGTHQVQNQHPNESMKGSH